jgi:hypothetical protein
MQATPTDSKVFGHSNALRTEEKEDVLMQATPADSNGFGSPQALRTEEEEDRRSFLSRLPLDVVLDILVPFLELPAVPDHVCSFNKDDCYSDELCQWCSCDFGAF